MDYEDFFTKLKIQFNIELDIKYQELISEGVEDISIKIAKILNKEKTTRFFDYWKDLESKNTFGFYFTKDNVFIKRMTRGQTIDDKMVYSNPMYYNFLEEKYYKLNDVDARLLVSENSFDFEKVFKIELHKFFKSLLHTNKNVFSNENYFLITRFFN